MTILKKHFQIDHWDDVNRISRCFWERGIECSLSQAYMLWKERSDAWEASWLFLPDNDDDIITSIDENCEIIYV